MTDEKSFSPNELEKILSAMHPRDAFEFHGEIEFFLESRFDMPLFSICGRINFIYYGQKGRKNEYVFIKSDSERYGGAVIKVSVDSHEGKPTIRSDGRRIELINTDDVFSIKINPLSQRATVNRYIDLEREALRFEGKPVRFI